jgi:TetR/AcrR family transcriptional repressor of nem operon
MYMARTLEFDYANALEKATRVFWKLGYAGTSLRPLLRAMGIGEGSFYNKLKSKNQAYLECLKHYHATVGQRRGAAFFSAPTGRAGVRALFNEVLNCLDNPLTPSKVCLMAASITREVLAEPNLKKFVLQEMSKMSEAMIARLKADQQAGLLPPDFDPATVVPIIITYLQGQWRMALVAYDRPKFEKQMDVFLTALGL